jgi:predicted transcriptional regulator
MAKAKAPRAKALRTPPFSVRLDPEMRDDLEAIGRDRDRPIGYLIKMAIKNFIKENKKKSSKSAA